MLFIDGIYDAFPVGCVFMEGVIEFRPYSLIVEGFGEGVVDEITGNRDVYAVDQLLDIGIGLDGNIIKIR